MAHLRHLKSAPITEAIIDIRVKARPGFQPQQFSALKELLAKQFPKVEERHSKSVEVEITPEGDSSRFKDLGLAGYFFKSSDEKLIAQFRVDGFTLNRLKPYSRWEEISKTAVQLWQAYRNIASPVAVTRIALRYINHIPLRPGVVDLDDYLTAAPAIPPGLPQLVSNFFYRITIQDETKGVAAHVTQALELMVATQKSTIVLDIDTFKDVDIAPQDTQLTSILYELRDLKNQIFFHYLTDTTIRSFE